MKKIISLVICITMMLSLSLPFSTTVIAATPQFEYEAQMLYDLGLFKGTENGFELEGICDRLQGATMFVRLLGEENEAIANPKSHPFNDVKDNWASPYIGQMYHQGYTKGSAANQYGTGTMTANQFATFCLRALDYEDGVDFTVNTALNKMLELHIIREDTYNLIANDGSFYRDYAVKLAYNTLAAEYKTRRALPLIEQKIKDFYAGKITEAEVVSFLKSHSEDDLWNIYYGGGYDLSNQYYLNSFLAAVNERREILLLELYRNEVVSKENLIKNILWIEDNMYLYTLPELFDKYLESTLTQYKPAVIEKIESYLGDISGDRKSAHINKAWETYDDYTWSITSHATNKFGLPDYIFENGVYHPIGIEYGPMRKCEYYLKGTHEVELTESEKSIVDFVQKEFLDKITDDMDAYDKVMLAYNFLCEHISPEGDAPSVISQSFPATFIEKKAGCCGLTQAMQFLLKLVDVECYVVDNIPKGSHAWNIVRLDDGNLYNVEVSIIGNPTPFVSADYYADSIDKEHFYIDLTCSDPANIKR